MEEKSYNLPAPEEIEALITAGQNQAVHQLLIEIHPSDIANLLDDLTPITAVTVFELLPIEIASEVLDETHSLVRQELVEKVDDEKLADLLDELPMDDAAEFLYDLPDPISDRLIDLMEPEEAEGVRELLSYEDETAGRLMTTEIAMLRRQWSVEQALAYLRSLENTETLHYLYVVDRHDRLLGVVPLRELILSPLEATIESLTYTDILTVQATADQEELAEMVARYDYFAIPVVDEESRLVGVVTVDDVIDIVNEELTEDIQRLGGSEPLDQPYFALSAWQLVHKRLPWLVALFIASVFTDAVVSGFDWLLVTLGGLSIFMPVVTGTGGNAGSQTVTTIIRALAVGEIRFADWWRALRREIAVGFIMGLTLGAMGLVRATLLNDDWRVTIVLALTLPLAVIWATAVATFIPLLADRLDIDPTVVSAPLITTIVDASGLFIYFQIAQLLLQAT